jgi:Holliday junction resolvase RusA-like endonuclease
MRLSIKPLSVNECWQGKRYKTPKYKSYERQLLLRLPLITLPPAPYHIKLTFGLSSKLADYDNPVKPFQDILQKRYKFDDRDIYKATIEKVLTKKGNEFIDFSIEHYEANQHP